MPILPVMALASTTVDIEEIYAGGLFAPEVVPDTLEGLNGGLDEDNYTGGPSSIPAWAAQYGTFAAGQYWGSDTFEYTYAKQLPANPNSKDLRSMQVTSASLSANFFIPWTASMVLYGWQAFFCQDAARVVKMVDAAYVLQGEEYWRVEVWYDGVRTSAATGLAASDVKLPAASPYEYDEALHTHTAFAAFEQKWHAPAKTILIPGPAANTTKGPHSIEVLIWVYQYDYNLSADSPDPIRKVKTPSGGVWALALR
jgi:hypothetical protein